MSLSAPVELADDNDFADPLEVIARHRLALEAAVRLDDWLLQGHCHLALGRASLALGDHRRSRQQLAEGTYILGALGSCP